MSFNTVKSLAQQYSAHQLETCIFSEIEDGRHTCTLGNGIIGFMPEEDTGDREAVVSVLAKAQAVRQHMEQYHVSVGEALRDLARRMRALQH